LVYRQRCPESVLADFLAQLQTRAERLGAWQAEAAAVQAGARAPAVVEEKARALCALGEDEKEGVGVGMGDGLAVAGRVLRLEGGDPFVQRLTHAAAFLAPCLSPEEGPWAGKPSVASIAELHKRGRELGAPRQELKRVEAALKACGRAADGVKALLPEGVTRGGHLRLKQQRTQRERRRPAALAEAGEEEDAAAGGGPDSGRAAQLGLETLMALVALLLDFPYKLERELLACLRLVATVTRLRRQAWELLGVRIGEDFAALDALLAEAQRLFPALEPAVAPVHVELEGAPRLFPRGLAPSAPASASASGTGAGAAAANEDQGGAKRGGGGGGGGGGAASQKGGKKGKKAYGLVKGRWEGRRFSFWPGPPVWKGVERLSGELRLLGVAVPEMALLEEKGDLVLSEDVEDEEGRGKGKGKLGSKKPAKRGWDTSLPFAASASAASSKPRPKPKPHAAVAVAAADTGAGAAACAAPVAAKKRGPMVVVLKEEEVGEGEGKTKRLRMVG
jgi:hypothetical protein